MAYPLLDRIPSLSLFVSISLSCDLPHFRLFFVVIFFHFLHSCMKMLKMQYLLLLASKCQSPS